ncbi:EAL domain-containing protein [Vibrio hyugaensis]|uniref:EAL domain-containing protein n=1 Tax=Vibrio hyugaensis TaxID=1534743 RepID=UPI000CE50C0A|nr:EAL domain-containing protein [Vibrio hyugaensis]
MSNLTREDKCKQVFADIRKGAFYPIFQPVYGLQVDFPLGVEVLTRWDTPRCIETSFRCIDEEGYANQFTKRLFQKLAKELRTLPSSIRFMSVNIPPSYLASMSFFADVLPLINACKRAKITLWLELTEKNQYPTEVADKTMFQMNIKVCRHFGIKIALDDFGSGNHKGEDIIRYVTPDIVKLDRSLLTMKGEQHVAFWQRLAGWKHKYQFDLVAEGIETQDDLCFVQSLSIHYAQGYYLHRPTLQDELDLNLPFEVLEQSQLLKRA